MLEAAVAPDAPDLTTGQFRHRVKAALHALDPDTFDERVKATAKRHRRLEKWDNPTGATDLALCDLPADQAHAIYNKITAVAQAMRTDGDTRTLDQLRADLATALLQGTTLPNAAQTLHTTSDTTPNATHTTTGTTPNPTPPTPNPTPGTTPDATSIPAPTRADDRTPGPPPDTTPGRPRGITPDTTHSPTAPNVDDPTLNAPSSTAPTAPGTTPTATPHRTPATTQHAAHTATPGTTHTATPGTARGAAAPHMDDPTLNVTSGAAPMARGTPATSQDPMRTATLGTTLTATPGRCAGGQMNRTSDTVPMAGSGDRGNPAAPVVVADPGVREQADFQLARLLAQVVERQLNEVRGQARAAGRLHQLAALTTRAVQLIELALSTLRDTHCQATGTDPDHHGHPGYRPPAALRQLIENRHPRCVFPSCNQPAARSDLDHTRPHHKGGTTCPCNLAPLCRRHHRTKATPGRHLSQPWPGLLVWTTPNGTWHTVTPHPRIE